LSPKVKKLAHPSPEVNKGDAPEPHVSGAGEGFPLKKSLGRDESDRRSRH
jgi:hypothetical protein